MKKAIHYGRVSKGGSHSIACGDFYNGITTTNSISGVTCKNCLIASAAPDLYKACKKAIKKLRGINIMGEEINPIEVKVLKAAIAKAEGRQA